MDSFDPKWEQIHAEREWGRVPNEHLARFVRKYFVNSMHKMAVDIGCGAGANTEYLWQRGFDVLGIDGSTSAINRCHFLYDRPNRLDFAVHDIASQPLREAYYHLAVDVCCLQHVPETGYSEALKNIHAALLSGGWFYTVTASRLHNQEIADTPLRLMDKEELEDALLGTGFGQLIIDKDFFTLDNGKYRVAHWLAAAQKR
jgi:SAM-dependent methyltransferase